MSRTHLLMIILNTAFAFLALTVAVRSSYLSIEAISYGKEANAKIEVLDTRSAKCSEAVDLLQAMQK